MAAVEIGVLALQGSFREHMTALRRLPGVEPVEIRTKEQLATVSGLIIPGASIADVPPPVFTRGHECMLAAEAHVTVLGQASRAPSFRCVPRYN